MKPRASFKRLPFRRRREGRTDYRKRLALLKSRRPRAVVRLTGGQGIVQIAEADTAGDRIAACATTRDLLKLGWESSLTGTPAVYLAGLLAGKRALAAGVADAVLDIGRATPTRGGRVFAALKGLVDAGLTIPHSEDLYPSAERLSGAHLAETLPPQVEAVVTRIMEGKS